MDEIMKFAKDFLALFEDVMFYYHRETNKFRLFWINRDRLVDVADMDFDEWADEVLFKNKVAENDISIFKIFCNAVKSCSAKGSYSFHSSLLSADASYTACKVRFVPKKYDNAQYVLGEWRIINEFTGNSIECYTENSCLDPLTGLFNKKSIADYAKKRLENTDLGQSALILLNLDDFKRINDNYGHKFGDQMLKSVAEIIRSVIGINGVEGRFSGDEFMIILNDAADELIIRNYLRAIKTNITMLFTETLGENRLTCSMGISRSRLDSNSYDELYKIAERVLYIAKQKGKNRYVIYKPELHGQVLTDSMSTAGYADSGAAAYSDTDLYKSAKLLSRVVVDGIEMLPRLLEQLSRTLMVDRIMVFWGDNYEMIAVSNPELYGSDIYPMILDSSHYVEQFSDDMLLIGDIHSLENSLPKEYSFLNGLGITSTMQHLLRDREEHINGLIVADECQSSHSFPQLAVQTFSLICKVINSMLLK